VNIRRRCARRNGAAKRTYTVYNTERGRIKPYRRCLQHTGCISAATVLCWRKKELPMTVNRTVRAAAGLFILLSLLLAWLHSPYWLGFTAFVGINLLQSAFTDWCPLMTILRKAGMKE